MHKLTDYRRPITRVEFSPGGDLLVGMGQKNLWCWTRSRGWELTGLQHPTGFAAFAFHPAGLTIAYSGLPPPSLSRTDAARPTDIRFHALNSSGTFAPDCIAVPAVPGALAHTVPFTTSLAFTPDGTMLLAKLLPVPAYAHRRAASWPLAWDGAAWRSGSPTLE